jgi:hypothetical protein
MALTNPIGLEEPDETPAVQPAAEKVAVSA